MGMKQISSQREINAYMEEEILKREKVLVNVLNRIGLECIKEARNNGTYIDRTGNLKSSIGYAVLKDGNVIKKSTFSVVEKGNEGKKKGLEFVDELISKYGRGYVLIVVAGMEYAAHVETGRNVLSSAELLANNLAPKLLSKLGFNKK